MLRDIERKVLRILWNFQSGRRRMPTPKELSVKTGRPESDLLFVIKKLEEQSFLTWDGVNMRSIQILKGWENNASVAPLSDYSRFLE